MEGHPHKSRAGIARIRNAVGYSGRGLRDAWRYEHAFRQELALVAASLPVIVLVPVSLLERVALGGTLILVLIVELLNSAIETVVDRISLDNHELSGRAKDLGSAAVMLSLALAAITWLAVLLPFARSLV